MEGATGKSKVVVVMGATATGKSKLAIDLALRFGGEVINSDKIQVHDGLDVVTNKVTDEERAGVPHHLIGGVHPEVDYEVADFCRDAARAVGSVLARGRLPIIAGGSNRYLEALLDGEPGFRRRHELCFLWVDAQLPVLRSYMHDRVDCMVEQGLVGEVRELFRLDADYSRGIRRSIGVPEMDAFFRHEASKALAGADDDEELRARLLAAAIGEIKANTCKLAHRQLLKIHRLRGLAGWSLHRLDVTRALALKVERTSSKAAQHAAWDADVVEPAARVVETFLHGGNVAGHGSGRDEQPMVGTTGAMEVAAEARCGLRLAVETAVALASRSGRGGFHGMEAAV
ncbi:adenylate isopentenyltransferase 5, chloroplastic-like [Oryza brachyantha]|uniref:adenylate dimethylallyltransferase (ADP/ATP-dependent) n=1 Tax=Oryza brachyantha TaxID=4533 RepID=J3LVR3_ORYBR|nr:adenylate isopentenyltransferase 5, chloroplastic-like [Oryza brachyantha]